MRSQATTSGAKGQPTVLVFSTGGTIGMHETPKGLAIDPNFESVLHDMVAAICEPLGFGYRVNHLSPAIDSGNADADTAPRIARLVRARVRTSRPRGVVITHGTDTMAFTASRLAFELSGLGAPAVVTGSQFAHGAPGSDARANLSLAIRAAMRANADAPVSIAFGAKLLPAARATKFDADSTLAFRAERDLTPYPRGVPSSMLHGSERNAPARVISFRFVPGVTTADLKAAVGGSPDGLVLETYGAGNAPMARPGMRQTIADIAAQLPVVAITQCALGTVDSSRYALGGELADTGVIDGGDMTLESAIAKLSFAIDAGLEPEPLQEFMLHNIVGERMASA